MKVRWKSQFKLQCLVNYDAALFCEIIESVPSVEFLRQEEVSGFIFRIYEGQKGMVIIDFDNDNFTDLLGIHYLKQFGLDHLIDAMFPSTEPRILMPVIASINKSKEDCTTCNGVGQMLDGDDLVPCEVCEGTGTKVDVKARLN